MNPKSAYLDIKKPLILAHRGARGSMPENTLPSFARAVELGAEALELDVHMTADRHLVVIHDATVERTTDGHGSVGSLFLEEIQRLDAGFRFSLDGGRTYPFRGRGLSITTLDEVLEAFPRIRVNVDLKDSDPRGAEILSDLVRRLHAESRVLCASFHTPVLVRFRQLQPTVPTSASRGEAMRFMMACWFGMAGLYRPMFNALQLPLRYWGIPLISPKTIGAAHRLGLSVHVWTINDSPTMRHLLNLRVDGIITDFPDRLLTIRNEWWNDRR